MPSGFPHGGRRVRSPHSIGRLNFGAHLSVAELMEILTLWFDFFFPVCGGIHEGCYAREAESGMSSGYPVVPGRGRTVPLHREGQAVRYPLPVSNSVGPCCCKAGTKATQERVTKEREAAGSPS